MGYFKIKITVELGYNVTEGTQYIASIKKNVALSEVFVKVKEKYFMTKYRPEHTNEDIERLKSSPYGKFSRTPEAEYR